MKYLDFSLPSGNLWYFPTQIQWLSDLTDEERSKIPTKEDYKELWNNVDLEYISGGNYILSNPFNKDCKVTVLRSQKYAVNFVDSILRLVKTHVTVCKFGAFEFDFTYDYWDTPCIIPQIIKKHVQTYNYSFASCSSILLCYSNSSLFSKSNFWITSIEKTHNPILWMGATF